MTDMAMDDSHRIEIVHFFDFFSNATQYLGGLPIKIFNILIYYKEIGTCR